MKKSTFFSMERILFSVFTYENLKQQAATQFLLLTQKKLALPIGNWRRGWDSNPRLLSGEPLFESGALNLSATSPINFIVVSHPTRLAQSFQDCPRGWDVLARFAPSAFLRSPNPRLLSGEPLFESGALNLSATSPESHKARYL